MDDYNSSPCDCKRERLELENKLSNLKDKAREFASALRKSTTGGGPKPEDPDETVIKMFDVIHGSSGDCLVGIGSRVESAAGISASISIEEYPEGREDMAIDRFDPSDTALSTEESQPQPGIGKKSVAGKSMYEYRKSSGKSCANAVAELQKSLLEEQVLLVRANRELMEDNGNESI